MRWRVRGQASRWPMGGRYDAHAAGREAERSQAGSVASQAFAHGGVGGLEVVLVDALGVGARLSSGPWIPPSQGGARGSSTSRSIVSGEDSALFREGLGPVNGHREVRRQFFHDPAAPTPAGLLPAAFAAVRNGLGQVLLVRRADDGNWELPGGHVEVGESASEAAIREVAEEAGVIIKVTGVLGRLQRSRTRAGLPAR
jgi:NUDIX domain